MTMWRNQKGASAVEFAIILPILIALFFGIVDFGLLIYDKQVITNASREGARAGVVQRIPRMSVTGITGVVNDYAANHLVTFGSRVDPVTTVPSGICASFGQDLDVIVSYNYKFLAVRTITITAQTTMKCE